MPKMLVESLERTEALSAGWDSWRVAVNALRKELRGWVGVCTGPAVQAWLAKR